MDVRLSVPSGLRAATAIVLLPLHLAACTTWKTRTVPPPAPAHLRLVLTQGGAVELWHARVVADSVIGYQRHPIVAPGFRAWDSTLVSVPSATIAPVRTRGFSAGKTTLLVVGIIAAIGAACGSSKSNSTYFC